jgi:hypothetical protein
MNDTPTSLPTVLNAIADRVEPVDLYDRVVRTSRALRRRRHLGGALAGACLVTAAVAALWPVWSERGPDPVTDPTVTPNPSPTRFVPPEPPAPVLPSRFVLADPENLDGRPPPDRWHGIYVWDGTSHERKISDIETPAVPIVSPDLTRLAWIDPDGALVVAKLDGSDRQDLGGGWCDFPVWAPDSSTVYAARLLHDATLTLQAIDPASGATSERFGIADTDRCDVAISSTGLTMAYFAANRVLRLISRDPDTGWTNRELSPDRWRSAEFADYDMTVTGVAADGSWVLVNYVDPAAGVFDFEYAPGAYDEWTNTATGVAFRFFGGYEGGRAFGVFLADGSLLSRQQIGLGPEDRFIAFRSADVRRKGPYVDAPAEIQGMTLVGVS